MEKLRGQEDPKKVSINNIKKVNINYSNYIKYSKMKTRRFLELKYK